MYDIGDYYEAPGVRQAIDYLENHDRGMIIAGGTDILVKTRERKKGYLGRDLVGITRIKELRRISVAADGSVSVGACCSFSQIEESDIIKKRIPLLGQAVGTVGGPQTRNAGTIGGNLCNGVTSADSASTLLVLNARLTIEGKKGTRQLYVKDFYRGPGQVALERSDVLKTITIAAEDYEGFRGRYIKFARRKAMDLAILGCAVQVKTKSRRVEDLRIGFGVAGPVPLRAEPAEQWARGKEISPELIQKIGEKCLESSRARDSWRGSKEYREDLMKELPRKALKELLRL